MVSSGGSVSSVESDLIESRLLKPRRDYHTL